MFAPDLSSGSEGTGASTTDGPAAICGNGFVDAGEACDLGEQNSNAGACLADCTTAQCGDGHLQLGVEQCDLGYGVNKNHGGCLPDCTIARCGDGEIQLGVENCDLGDHNSTVYGGCNPTTCQPEPYCGDGIVQPEHEICDPAVEAPDDPAASACDHGCRYFGRIVFISSTTSTGDIGSVSDADLRCQVLAAQFDGEHATRYRAWLSDTKSSPASRFAHGPEFANTPYVLRNGIVVAGSFDDLILAGPTAPITLTETGATLTEAAVWTNTTFDGLPLSETDHCGSWKDDTPLSFARFGMNSPGAEGLKSWREQRIWTSFDDYPCSKAFHLYCFEQ